MPVSTAALDVQVQELIWRTKHDKGAWILTLNTEMIARGARDPAYWALVKRSDVITADGMPLVWASRVKRRSSAIAGRTTGVDLVDALLRGSEVPRFAVIGGRDPASTIELYGANATSVCAFLFNGKVDLEESQISFFCEEIVRHQVKVVFVALGVPKQDLLAVSLRQRLPLIVVMGVGGAFEILGPRGGRAPWWMQRSGLEWLYRLLKEPGRLWRRYLLNYPRGLWVLVKDVLSSLRRTPS